MNTAQSHKLYFSQAMKNSFFQKNITLNVFFYTHFSSLAKNYRNSPTQKTSIQIFRKSQNNAIGFSPVPCEARFYPSTKSSESTTGDWKNIQNE